MSPKPIKGGLTTPPPVVDEFDTVRTIIKHRSSIGRYGDGELKLCAGYPQKTQHPDPQICKRLRQILWADDKNFLVAIPRIWNRDWSDVFSKRTEFWKRYMGSKTLQFLKPGKTYYSAFITRPDAVPELQCDEYWNLCKQMWAGRDLTVLWGGHKIQKHKDFFDSAATVEYVQGPEIEAWGHYQEMMDAILSKPADRLVLLAMGPTATVMAYDLFKAGRQAIDIGHMPSFYGRLHPKTPLDRPFQWMRRVLGPFAASYEPINGASRKGEKDK